MTARLVVLASGSGTNCEAVMEACERGELDASVVGVITNEADAGVIARAARFDVPVTIVEHRGSDPDVDGTQITFKGGQVGHDNFFASVLRGQPIQRVNFQ